jgi:hypothetical protein
LRMETELQIDTGRFEAQFAIYVQLVDRDLETEMVHQGKKFLEKTIKITPPGYSRGGKMRSVTDARKAGERAVRRDLRRIFTPVDLRGSRRVTHLFGKPHPAAPWEVPTKEYHPDVAGIFRQHRASGKAGRAARYKAGTLYVDRQKFAEVEAMLIKRVGWLSGGFTRAGLSLGARMPAYAKRHTAPGSIRITNTPELMQIHIINDVRYAARVEGLRRRIQWAVDAQASAMERQIPYLLRRHEKVVN